jgi:hypothetical protein
MDAAMIKPAPPQSRGIAGVLFVCLLAVATAGLLIDLFVMRGPRFSVLADPGVRAALGAGVAVLSALTAFAVRLVLGRPVRDGETRARDHA